MIENNEQLKQDSREGFIVVTQVNKLKINMYGAKG